MSKYDLLALPVVDETGKLLGIVTVDDALDVLEEESAEDLALATGSSEHGGPVANMLWWLLRRNVWLLVWAVIAFAVVAGTPRLFPDLGEVGDLRPAGRAPASAPPAHRRGRLVSAPSPR